jgi:arsenate reductase
MSVTIYHNPRCSKSRQTLALLEEKGINPTIIEYLNTPPDKATLQNILGQLELSAAELMRTGEDEYKAAKQAIAAMDEAAQIAWLIANPKVIERPIVVTENGARIGRPPERILEIIS